MSVTNQKKRRLRWILIAAAALGSSSATMSGVLGTLAFQQPTSSQAQLA